MVKWIKMSTQKYKKGCSRSTCFRWKRQINMPPSTTLEEFMADFRALQAIFIYLPPSILLLAASAYGYVDSTPYKLPAPSVVHRSALQPIFVHHSKPALWMSCLKNKGPERLKYMAPFERNANVFFVYIHTPIGSSFFYHCRGY